MRNVILLIFFLFPVTQIISQSLNVHFDSYIWDFGYIKESDGKVMHNFSIRNDETNSVEIEQITTSCGCMAPFISKKVIPPGETATIKIEYDPSGRPGRFIKSAEIKIKGKSQTQTYFINLKGIVIEKEILPEYVENWEFAELKIKPCYFPLVSETDFRFLNQTALQNFINDLTYEIDQHNFATVKLELYKNNSMNADEFAESVFTPLKKFIITELIRRNYSRNQVGFSDNAFVKCDSTLNHSLAILKVSSLEMNDDQIRESGFFPDEKKGAAYFNQLAAQKQTEDSLRLKKFTGRTYTQQNNLSNIDSKNENYQKFIQQSAREVLMNGVINLRVAIESHAMKNKTGSERKKEEAIALKIQQRIARDLQAEGIPDDKIIFALPKIIISNNTAGEKKLIVSNYNQLAEESKFSRLDMWLAKNDTLYRPGQKPRPNSGITAPFQDLPTYLQYCSKGKTETDTSKRDFAIWCKAMSAVMNSGRKLIFLIESSESNTPSVKKTDPNLIARKRSEFITAYLKNYFHRAGISENDFRFMDPVNVARGLSFESREFGVSFYEKYQYLKIIPLYDTIQDHTADVFPYQINFKYNYFEIPVQSDVFQVFINRLVPEINQTGYVKLIVESSSSRVKTDNFSSNDALSFSRIEDLRNKLYEEIIRRGLDPRRIIITEERSLVQGPPYLNGDNKMNPVFQPYQYIKIIPEIIYK